MKYGKFLSIFISGCAALCGAVSCVNADSHLGYSIVPEEEKYITRCFEVPIGEIQQVFLDSLSAYNSSRMTIGSLRDEHFGLTRRGTAFHLMPVNDTLDWGENPHFTQFHLSAVKDTTSYSLDSEEKIIQSLKVYAMEKKLDENYRFSCDIKNSDFALKPIISVGTPTYNGGDSLSIDLCEAFAMTYIGKGKEPVDSAEAYYTKHPGLYICCDDPVGTGGRINMFELNFKTEDTYYVTGNFAELKFKADFTSSSGKLRKQVDTSILFMLGAMDTTSTATCYAFNSCEHESKDKFTPGPATGQVFIEGGVGLKPMIRAEYLKNLVMDTVRDTLVKYGLDPTEVFKNKKCIINKATLNLPYEYREGSTNLDFYPIVLNPTIRVSKKDTVSYAALTDASVSDEDQGDIDYSLCRYKPDISHHLQEIMHMNSADTLKRANVWFMILANETVDSSSSSSSSTSDYYSQLAYLNYYNSMMYGGYSGYGYSSYGYGSSYDNYYSYYMMQQLYSSMYSSSSTSTTQTLDKDRFYKAALYGPGAAGEKVPTLQVTYSFLNEKGK